MQTYCLFAGFLLSLFLLSSVAAQPFDYPKANLSTTWTNAVSAPHSVSFTDGSTVRAILLRGSFGPKFACGFYCNGGIGTTCNNSYLFAVFIVQTNSGSGIVQPAIGFPQVVWSANRNRPVKLGATLQLTPEGDLVLRDSDGSTVWSTKTAGKSVSGMNMTDTGNLVLFDAKNRIVWQSFDHPTDSLVPGQRLIEGQRNGLSTASASPANRSNGDMYSVEVMKNQGLFAYRGRQRQVYYKYLVNGTVTRRGDDRSYVRFLNGSLAFFIRTAEPNRPDGAITVPRASSAQYMKLMPDGHLKVWEWQSGWKVVADLFGVPRRRGN